MATSSYQKTRSVPLRPNKFGQTRRWIDVRGRHLGMWAYSLNRITGLGLVIYLYLHLGVLSLLLGGQKNWDTFVAVARSPFVLALDVLLLAGILIHGFNGMRLALTGFGIGVRSQRLLFLVFMFVAAFTLVVATLKIYHF